MKYSELEALIAADLKAILEPRGYKHHKRKKSFTKKTSAGFQQISVPISNYAPQFNVGITFGIRLEAVQTRLNDFWKYSDLGRKEGTTVITRLAYFLNEDLNFELEIEGDDDIEGVRRQLREVVSENEAAHFEKFSDIAFLDKELNTDPSAIYRHMYGLPTKAFNGTIIAHLNKNPDFEQLATYYAKELRERNNAHSDRYEGLVRFLRNEHLAE